MIKKTPIFILTEGEIVGYVVKKQIGGGGYVMASKDFESKPDAGRLLTVEEEILIIAKYEKDYLVDAFDNLITDIEKAQRDLTASVIGAEN